MVDLLSGRELYARDGDGAYNVASNTKIVTTAAALALLGPEFTTATEVFAGELEASGAIKGDLFLVARGNPYLYTEDLDDLARQLSRAGVRRFTGGITVDDTYFDSDDLPPHFDEQPDEQASFRAPVGALSLNFNGVNLSVRPGPAVGAPAIVDVDPPNGYVRVVSSVQTSGRGRTRLAVRTNELPDALELTVAGQIRVNASPRNLRRRVPNPLRYGATAFAKALAREGIRLGRADVRRGPVPVDATRYAGRSSPPVAEMVRALGKFSNNFVAETLLKIIGAEVSDAPLAPATWKDGLRAVRSYLTDTVGLAPNSFRYENGSGLFDSSEFSPRQMTRVIRAAYSDFRIGPDLLASLAIGGADGTLATRMQQSDAERQVRAKTGTLDEVSALSGIIATDMRRPLAFSILVNDIPRARGSLPAARAMQDEMSSIIVRYLQRTSE